MIELNYSLRIAYQQALLGIQDVPVFYMEAPQDRDYDNFIVHRGLINNDASTKHSSDTNTNYTVEIHTATDVVNSGLSNDQIAREVFNRIYPNRQFALVIDGGQIVNTLLSEDRTDNYGTLGSKHFISRFITFTHNIYQRSDIS